MEKIFVGMKVSHSNGIDTVPGTITQIGSNGKWFEYHENACEATSSGMGHQDWDIKREIFPKRHFAKLVNGKWYPAILNEETNRLKIEQYSRIILGKHIKHYNWEF